MNSREQVKIMMVKRCLKVWQLAEMLQEKTGKRYTRQSLQHKISASSLRYDEVKTIADLLGFEISIEDAEKSKK